MNMTDFNFEGANGLHEKQLKFINDVLLERGFKNNKVVFEPAGKSGDNYVAAVNRITVEESDGKVFKIIAKIAPQHELLRQVVCAQEMFSNENIMYSKLLPKCLSMQKNAGVPEDELFKFPEFYGSLMEKPYEIILLEDLQVKQFAMLDRTKPLSNECVKLVLKQFAILHSISFVLKNEDPDTFLDIVNGLWNIWNYATQTKEVAENFKKMEDDIMSIISEELRPKIKDTLSQLREIALVEHNFVQKSKHTVILQGDAWTNNILFKSQGDKVTDCIMIDYQISRCSSPVADLMYFIFNCTDYETRLRHYDEWMDYYHSEMGKSLANFGLKIKNIYPKDQIDIDMKRTGKMGITLALMVSVMSLRETDNDTDAVDAVTDVLLKSPTDLNSPVTLKFKERVEGILKSFIEYGYLK